VLDEMIVDTVDRFGLGGNLNLDWNEFAFDRDVGLHDASPYIVDF
jgi:hypothetical protein|tara:strand:- start:897 stop:1031 length:135 start_codon:yes stop_codon:yes gene_type:complete